MKQTRSQGDLCFVASERVVSKPGAKIEVKVLTLTDAGRRAITTGINGIYEDARGRVVPPARSKKSLQPA
jgi:hypothetical protein